MHISNVFIKVNWEALSYSMVRVLFVSIRSLMITSILFLCVLSIRLLSLSSFFWTIPKSESCSFSTHITLSNMPTKALSNWCLFTQSLSLLNCLVPVTFLGLLWLINSSHLCFLLTWNHAHSLIHHHLTYFWFLSNSNTSYLYRSYLFMITNWQQNVLWIFITNFVTFFMLTQAKIIKGFWSNQQFWLFRHVWI